MTKEERNEKQRARRASPEQKAIEAAASRVSYWRRRYLASPLDNDTLEHDRLDAERTTLRALRGAA